MSTARNRRTASGCLILLVVNCLWVFSAECSRYLFAHDNFKRPLFVTYVKTGMFSIYLLGFVWNREWRMMCRKKRNKKKPSNIEACDNSMANVLPVLSKPEFQPTRFPSAESSTEESNEMTASEMSDSEEAVVSESSRQKVVRFSDVHEVRHLPEEEALDAFLSRLPYDIWVRISHQNPFKSKLNIWQTMKLSFQFSILWFSANIFYSEALTLTESSIVNILSSTSALFTLLFACVLPSNIGDRFTVTKLFLVCLRCGAHSGACFALLRNFHFNYFHSIVGVSMVSYVDHTSFEVSTPLGVVWAIFGSIGYSTYVVLLRHQVDCEEKLEIPMFFGFVGVFCLLTLWPALFLFDYLGIESLHPMPNSSQWRYIILNGLFGTVLSEYMWLWGCFLTSSLIATLSLCLVIPMTLLVDHILWKTEFSIALYIGTVPVLISFFGATYLSLHEDWDPVAAGIRWLYNKLNFCTRLKNKLSGAKSRTKLDEEQSESLIDVIS
ncbi:Solute carrier family 35 member F5 [Trichinella nativa]|uniref:Solute carrier family 35 member F5 n=1 Tax=Trichinella nativa TaxID=6335 RepID=A0A0V1LI86_9BILA|nr:Solute carrier family 35 member F5 [Trichinella sp. T6]KRZ59217.1 Solute carrier family 35 member F5 [Trichinella nativa]